MGKVLAEGGSQFPCMGKRGSNTRESFRIVAGAAQRRSGAGRVYECQWLGDKGAVRPEVLAYGFCFLSIAAIPKVLGLCF